MVILQICHYKVVASDKGTFHMTNIKNNRMCFISKDEMDYIHEHMSCEACDFVWRYRMRDYSK